jgi:RNA recognition motif-containing protein
LLVCWLVFFIPKLVANSQEDKLGKQKIWIYYDKQTGQPKGDATLTYEDEETATTSLEWFNGQPFMGNNLQVERADVYDWEAKRGARGGRGGRGRGGGGRY